MTEMNFSAYWSCKAKTTLWLPLQLEGCKAIIEEGVKLLGGRLDALVNNAGEANMARNLFAAHTKEEASQYPAAVPAGIPQHATKPSQV